MWCKKWYNWTFGVGQKIRLQLPVLLGIRLRFQPKTSDSLRLRNPDLKKTEIANYLKSKVRPNKADTLGWWHNSDEWLPLLNQLVSKCLCIPVTSTSSENLFAVQSQLLQSCSGQTLKSRNMYWPVMNLCFDCFVITKLVTSLGHQGRRRVFWEGLKLCKLFPTVLNNVQHIFPVGLGLPG